MYLIEGMFARLVCFFRGHKRGRYSHMDFLSLPNEKFKVYACARCGHETRYKVKDENNGAAGDEA